MSGTYFLRVSNPTGAAINTVPANGTFLYPEGQVGNLTLDSSNLRSSPVSTVLGSSSAQKAKIVSAQALNTTGNGWAVYTALSGLLIELGHMDNDGFFTVYFSSNTN